MKILLLLISAFIVSLSAMAQEVPYRNDADFKVFSSFQWITDKPEDSPDYSVSPSKKFDPDPKMHLFLTINLNNIQDNEFRVRVYDSGNELTYGKKLKEGMELKLNFGDFEKVKKREIPYLFTIFILDKKRNNLNKIKVEVLENGAVFINDKPLGKTNSTH